MNKRVTDAVKKQKSRWRYLAPASGLFLDLFMFSLVIGAACAGVYLLWDKALADPRFRIDGETLSLAGAIRECPESVAEMEALGKRFEGRSLLDPRLVGDMEKAYGDSVWIKEITHLRRRFPNRVDVEFLLRMPTAQVWHEGRYWMISLDATVLPVAGSTTPFIALPEIVGATPDIIARRPAPGAVWTDEGVLGALGVMKALWGSSMADVLPVERVVVNAGALREHPTLENIRRRFELVTRQGVVVRWGTFNFGDIAGELTSSEKLFHLRQLLLNDEALRDGVSFDVRTSLPGYSVLN